MQEKLTARQEDVARLLSEGYTNREIAEKLGISELTVANHVRECLAKAPAPNRTKLAIIINTLKGKFG